jgi:cellulose synthase/poly-beta-1,6-N-acetylglucosamine synthase-like glycosyltransferase
MVIEARSFLKPIFSPGEDGFHCSVGVMAYNEEANIANTLQAILSQRTTNCYIDEIFVIASGCTDNTEAIVQEISKQHPKVKLICQKHREGKASAINLFLSHVTTNTMVIVGADTIPAPHSIQRLVEPFADPDVGMTGGRPVPLNDPDTFMGFSVHMLWELHHQIALQTPKMGEITAFRRIFHRIPVRSAVDEACMEPLISGQGYQLRYVANAIVYNRGPNTVAEFLKQRRRIYAGHVKLRQKQGYEVSTMSIFHILPAILHAWQWNPRFFLYLPAVIGLEFFARILGWVDYNIKKRDHAVWEVITTTKEL